MSVSDLGERALRARLRQLVFKKGRVVCPHCGRYRIQTVEGRYWCGQCRKKFSLTSRTWLRSMKVPLRTFFGLLDCWFHEVPVSEAARQYRISVVSTRYWYRKFRLYVTEEAVFKPQESVQVDEAYFGRFKKGANYLHGYRKYQVMNKVCVAGISCPKTGTLATRVIPDLPGIRIKAFIREKVPTDVHVYADGSHLYTRLDTTHFLIQRTHDLGFQTAYYIESCWSWMKRKLFKMYHHFTRRYAPEYVRELTWRFNTRREPKDSLVLLARSFTRCSICLT